MTLPVMIDPSSYYMHLTIYVLLMHPDTVPIYNIKCDRPLRCFKNPCFCQDLSVDLCFSNDLKKACEFFFVVCLELYWWTCDAPVFLVLLAEDLIIII